MQNHDIVIEISVSIARARQEVFMVIQEGESPLGSTPLSSKEIQVYITVL